MTQQEFESLQVGDVITFCGTRMVVLRNVAGVVSVSNRPTGTFTKEAASNMEVVSRVLSRGNVKGGA